MCWCVHYQHWPPDIDFQGVGVWKRGGWLDHNSTASTVIANVTDNFLSLWLLIGKCFWSSGFAFHFCGDFVRWGPSQVLTIVNQATYSMRFDLVFFYCFKWPKHLFYHTVTDSMLLHPVPFWPAYSLSISLSHSNNAKTNLSPIAQSPGGPEEIPLYFFACGLQTQMGCIPQHIRCSAVTIISSERFIYKLLNATRESKCSQVTCLHQYTPLCFSAISGAPTQNKWLWTTAKAWSPHYLTAQVFA